MSLTYPTFCQWFLTHYGRAFAASEAEYEAALHQPCHNTGETKQLQHEYKFDYETDQHEGW